jgi:hypothetical protein
MDVSVVIECLIAWAVGKAGRMVNGLTDRALDQGADQIWAVVAGKLGADPAIQQLLAESRETGDASPPTRANAQKTLQDAVAGDPQFAADLRAALPDVNNQGTGSGANLGIMIRDIHGGRGNIDIINGNKVNNFVKRNPVFAAIIGIVAVVLLVWIGSKVIGGTSGTTGADSTAIVGTWTASDGTGIKTMGSNNQCAGFYYANGTPLDIGGPMSCAISSKPDAQNRYSLTVTQSPNKNTYKIQFDTVDQATVYSSTGQRLYAITRS